MPKVTARQLKRAYESDPDRTSHSLAKLLGESGFPVTDDWVKEEIGRQLRGEGPHPRGTAFLLHTWLTDGYSY